MSPPKVFSFLATAGHYADHLTPIWDALAPDERGAFLRRLPPSPSPELLRGTDVWVASGISDVRLIRRFAPGNRRSRIVLFEHGAGFHYGTANPGYSGGSDREDLASMPATNRWVAEANRAKYPGIPSEIVGCPKMDAFCIVGPPREPDLVAVSFHWDYRFLPETRSAYPHYRSALPHLARRFKVIGHAHPRVWAKMRAAYRAARIPAVQSFADVVARAGCYVVDTSSTLYEFAALDRPVVVLNAPWYRRDVDHGLRFWDHADVGVQVDDPRDLPDAVAQAMADGERQQALRRRAVAEVFPHRGSSVARAVEELRRVELRT